MTASTLNEANIKLFKDYIGQHFTAQQLTKVQDAISLYISIIAAEEMDVRIYSDLRHDDTEVRLKWVADFSTTLAWFLKNSWQAK